MTDNPSSLVGIAVVILCVGALLNVLLLAHTVNIIHCKVWWDTAKIGVESGVAPVKTKLSAKEIININRFIAVYNLIQGYLPDELHKMCLPADHIGL